MIRTMVQLQVAYPSGEPAALLGVLAETLRLGPGSVVEVTRDDDGIEVSCTRARIHEVRCHVLRHSGVRAQVEERDLVDVLAVLASATSDGDAERTALIDALAADWTVRYGRALTRAQVTRMLLAYALACLA